MQRWSDAMRKIHTRQLCNLMKKESGMMKHRPGVKEVGKKRRRIMIL
jgi:hypothetical protein